MTPQEISDYRIKWMSKNPHPVKIHSDLEYQGKQWCKSILESHEWKFQKLTDVYEHTFYFENIRAAQNFQMEFSNHVIK